MTTIHIIEDERERAIVKRIFRQRMECVADAAMDLSPNAMDGDGWLTNDCEMVEPFVDRSINK